MPLESNNQTNYTPVVLLDKICAVILDGKRVLNHCYSLFTIFIKLFIISLFIAFLLNSQQSYAEEIKKESRPKTALVLAGGGALGFAHVGVLKVLERERIPIDIITGTSMGSIVGAAYSSGASLEEIDKILSNTNWDELFMEGPKRSDLPYSHKSGRNRELLGDSKIGILNGKVVLPTGFLQGQKIRPVLQKLYYRYPESLSFDELPIRFRAVAADLETGKAVILDKGDLSLASRASMAVPGIFAPVIIKKQVLVDGGIANNLPIDIAKDLGAERIIVVELNAELKKIEELSNPISITGQIISLLLAQNSSIQKKLLTKKDILIEPPLNNLSSSDFNKASEIIKRGEDAAEKAIAQLQRFAVSDAEYKKYQEKRTKYENPNTKIEFIKIAGKTTIPENILKEKITVKEGETLDTKKVDESVDNIFSLGAYSQVSSMVVKENEKKGIEFSLHEKEWWKQYFRIGMSLEDSFTGNGFYNLGIGLRLNDIMPNSGYIDTRLRLGRSNFIQSEISDPIFSGSNFFYGVDGLIGRSPLFFQENGDLLAEYTRKRIQAGLKIGYGFFTPFQIVSGFRRGKGQIERRVGDPSLQELDFEVGDLYSSFVYDTLNEVDFPSQGFMVRAGISQTLKSITDDTDFTEFNATIVKPFKIKDDHFVLKSEFSDTVGKRSFGRSYTLGGFLDVSGYTENTIIASDYFLNSLTYYHELDNSSPLLGYNLFLGASLEALSTLSSVSVIEDKNFLISGSVFIGINTPILPAYIGYGHAESGNNALYLVLGRITSGSQRLDGE